MIDAAKLRWWRRVTRARLRWMEADAGQGAAALAYYLLVSLLPFLIVLVAAGSLFFARDVTAQAVVQLVNHFTPLTAAQARSGESAIRDILVRGDATSITALLLMMIGSLQFLRTLIRTTNRIWRSPPYSWWRLPLKSVTLLGVAAGGALIGILLPEFAVWIQPRLAASVPSVRWAFVLVIGAIPWLVLFGGFTTIYRLAPSRATTFGEVWIGALVATVLMGMGQLLFHIYAVHFGHFGVYYGSLGASVAFALWIYVASCACVFGTCVSAAGTDDSPAGAPES